LVLVYVIGKVLTAAPSVSCSLTAPQGSDRDTRSEMRFK